jgi:galactose mutarotase-like enzyme
MPISIIPTDQGTLPELRHSTSNQFEIKRYRLTEGKQSGCELIGVSSPSASALICPTRGMSLWKARLGEVECGWNSPVRGPVHPSLVPLADPSGLGWLEGFDELLVRCGLRSFGAPDFDSNGKLLYPLHGCIGNVPAENVNIDLSPDRRTLTITGDVYETRFLLYNLRLSVKYTFQLGQPEISIGDVVTNLGGSTTTHQLLYHINFGSPLLTSGSQFQLAAPQIVARNQRAEEGLESWHQYLGPTAGYAEQVYFAQPVADASGWVNSLLHNSLRTQGVAVCYRNQTLPYFTLWKNTADQATGYVTGLEPGTGFPNPRSFEEQQQRVISLQPGQSRHYDLRLVGLSDSQSIEELSGKLSNLLEKPPELHSFRSDWCMPG